MRYPPCTPPTAKAATQPPTYAAATSVRYPQPTLQSWKKCCMRDHSPADTHPRSRRMKRRDFLKTTAATVAAGSLGAPAIAQSAAKTLRFVPQANLANPDPIWTTATVAINHGYMVWDTLYGIDNAGIGQPQMLAGYEVSDDKLTWTFTLRDGLLFHDNAPVRGIDCVTSIARWSKRDPFGQQLALQTNEMKALDDKRFTIRLKRP